MLDLDSNMKEPAQKRSHERNAQAVAAVFECNKFCTQRLLPLVDTFS
jgi:hypothetical protein